MFTIHITERGATATVREFDQPEVNIGRIQGNDIVLPKSNISKRHARIIRKGAQFVVVDNNSTNGTYVNGERIAAPLALGPGDKVFVGDFTLEIQAQKLDPESTLELSPPALPAGEVSAEAVLTEDDWSNDAAAVDQWDEGAWGAQAQDAGAQSGHDSPAPQPHAVLPDSVRAELADLEAELDPGEFAEVLEPEEFSPAPSALPTLRNQLVIAELPPDDEPAQDPPPAGPRATAPESQPNPPRALVDEESTVLRAVHERLVRSMDLRRLNIERMADDELRARTRDAANGIIDAMSKAGELPTAVSTERLLESVLDEALGLGPLEDLLADETVTEIMVNGAKQIFLERKGRLVQADRSFSSDQAVLGVIERIVTPLGRRIDESSPMVDARLKDGSRVNAIIPPLALNGPVLTIRKFSREPLQIADLVAFGTLSSDMASFLATCVQARCNILISGGTGSGKTTTLNVLSSHLPDGERIVTIEDAAELRLRQTHVVRLESRPANIEGRGEVTIRDLVRNALRMRPDRIVIGECRGGEALDMLQAMNTGHDGSLTTVHANTPRDALARLETMVLMSGMDLPVRAIRDQIASAIDIVVQQTRFGDGSRRVTHISEITGMEGDVITMQDIFSFEQRGIDAKGKLQGKHKPCGFVPHFYEELPARGIAARLDMFQV